MVVTTGAIRCAKLQSKHRTNKPTPSFFTGGCPSCRPTNCQCHSTEGKMTYDLDHYHQLNNAFQSSKKSVQKISQGAPSFSTLIFHDFSMTKKMKIHDLSAQHIFPSKRYTTYECIPELVVTVPSAHSTIVKKIKRFII